MSTTYHIGCMDCKEYLWIGQSTTRTDQPSVGQAGWYLYIGSDTTMRQFHEFMRKHISQRIEEWGDWQPEHRLVFFDDQRDTDDWSDITDYGDDE